MACRGALLKCFRSQKAAAFCWGNKAGGASTATGFGYELEDIAACTIGGASTNGGVGKVSGVIIGVLVFEVLEICLQFMGVGPAQTFYCAGLRHHCGVWLWI